MHDKLTGICSEGRSGLCIRSRWSCVAVQSLSFVFRAQGLCWIAAIYKGTVNDPTSFPPPSKSHGSYHWAFERFLAAGLVPLTAAAFVTSGSSAPLLDGILGVSLVMHSHIGVRPSYSYIIRTVTNIHT